MADEKLHIEGISSEIILRQNARIRRVSIRINASLGVVVSYPIGIQKRKVIEFISTKKEWINKHTTNYNIQKTEFLTSNTFILANNHKLLFQFIEHNVTKFKTTDLETTVSIPKNLNFEKQKEIKRVYIQNVMYEQAYIYLPTRLAFLAEKHNFQYGKVTLRNQKTRWGSCSYQNNISLNIQLMRLPSHLVDYVLIHELAHTIEKNHSNSFWELVYSKMGISLNKCKKELKTQNLHF